MGSDDQHDLAIRRLRQMGGQHGQVTPDQIKSVLPIDEMTPGELARAMVHLEEAGVEVILEEDLLRPRPGSGEERVGAPIDPVLGIPDPERAPTVRPALPPASTASSAVFPGAGHDGPGPRHRTATLTLVVVLILIVLGVLLHALTS